VTGKGDGTNLLLGMVFPQKFLISVIEADDPIPIELIKGRIRRGSAIVDDGYGARLSPDVVKYRSQLILGQHPQILCDEDLGIRLENWPRVKITVVTT
jgi:hypothetical protein